MRLMQVGDRGHEIPVAVIDGVGYDLRPLVPRIDGDALRAHSRDRIAAAAADGRLAVVDDLDTHRVGAPISRPGAIVCIGMNYAAHAAESGSAPPEVPIMFLKVPSTVAGPFDDVAIPRRSTKTDWEVELGVVIGEPALYLDSPADSRAHIAGYLLANDLSERDWQLADSGGQWSKGKCAPGFSPLGPWIATGDEFDPTAVRLRSWVNGEPRQDSSTADLIFGVDFLVWHLSQYLALEPGDVVLTGTPEGVALSGRFPYLREGDVVEVEIAGLGRQRQVVGQAR